MCGDQVTITCHVEEKSTAALTTQGSTKVSTTPPAREFFCGPRPATSRLHFFVCVPSPPEDTRSRASFLDPGALRGTLSHDSLRLHTAVRVWPS